MAKWIEYTRSDEQINEIKSADHGVLFWYVADYGVDRAIYRYKDDKYHVDNRMWAKAISKYLICEPHPYADIIEIWAKTGCKVYVRVTKIGDKNEFPELSQYIESVEHTETYCTDKPDWNIPGAEYRLAPFEST